ncbi:MAG: transcription antitermination factor NusB, partial [Planctomycetes bacterium]|nr:transcription antitermination factor NusB [Planctomycetota bacterium]
MTKVKERQQDEHATRARSQGREFALKLLYLFDIRGKEDADKEMPLLFAREPAHRESHSFARELYEGTASRCEELDAKIVGIAENWNIGRMAYIDRAILRMGVYELLFCQDIPPKVTISEGIELAKRYSTDKSSAFVNGILDKVFQT